MRLRIFSLISLLLTIALPCLAQDRGLFVSVIQEPQTLSDSTAIAKLVDYSATHDIKNLFVQVYRANKSWFPSKLADQSPYLRCSAAVGQDPLQLLINLAHGRGIKVYAWMNMLTLSENKNAPILQKYGPSILTTNRTTKNKLSDYKIDSQYFLEPSDSRVRRELTLLVEEVVTAYPGLDGLLFDYVRYPDVHPDYGYSAENLASFKEHTGIARPAASTPAWQDWKRQMVSETLLLLCGKARSLRPGISVAATGCAPFSRAYNEAFQDWPAWLENKTVDFVAFMSYEGEIDAYRASIASAKAKIPAMNNVMLTVGAYKQLKTPELFSRQLQICEQAGSDGCIIFHYGSLLESPKLGTFPAAKRRTVKGVPADS